MWLEIKNTENVDVFVASLFDYEYKGRGISYVGQGKRYGILAGKDFYVIGVSNSYLSGFIKMDYWLKKYEEPKEAEPVSPTPQP